MHQDDARARELEDVLDRIFDLAETGIDTDFSDESSWVDALRPDCDLDSEY